MSRTPLPIRRRIGSKLIVIYLVPTLMIISGFGLVFYFMVRGALEQEMGRRLAAVASGAALILPTERIAMLAPGEQDSLNYELLRERLLRVRDSHAATRIYVFDPAGLSLVDTQPGVRIGQQLPELQADRLEIERVLSGSTAIGTLFADGSGRLYLSGYAPVSDEQGNIAAVVRVDASAVFFDSLRALRRNIIFLDCLAGLAIVVVSILFASRIERPIAALVRGAQRIGEGELSAPIEALTDDEIGFLAASMEEMRAKIVARDEHLLMLQRGIAHEVRNPLGGMGLFLDLLDEELPQEQSEARSYVTKIRKEVRALDHVVNDFLDFTRPIVPDQRAIELAAFIDEVLPLISSQVLERNIGLEREYAHARPTYRFDPELLRRVLLNLLTNAVQACGAGGVVRIVTAEREGRLWISIIDNGAGIAAENMAKIFQPFFTTKERGTGLGLSYSNKIVEALGGAIRISSAPGRGTEVTILLDQAPPGREGD